MHLNKHVHIPKDAVLLTDMC